MKYSSRYRDRPKDTRLGLLPMIAEKQAKLQRLGLPEREARDFALRLAKHKLGID